MIKSIGIKILPQGLPETTRVGQGCTRYAMKKFDRRKFIKLLSAGVAVLLALPLLEKLLVTPGLAQKAKSADTAAPDFNKGAYSYWARLRFRLQPPEPENWWAHYQADLKLINFINKNTSANIRETWEVVDVSKLEHMCRFPFIFMHAQVRTAFTAQERKNLREYMERGGFLFIDDCLLDAAHPDVFFQSIKKDLSTLIPGAEWVKLPADHPIYHCFYNMPNGQPHMQGAIRGGWGYMYKKRMMAYLTASDLHCGWIFADAFGQAKVREALKMGANIYLYAITH
ncbi:DUF4159 domain-containing protein [Verrucomicrobiota bacterium]